MKKLLIIAMLGATVLFCDPKADAASLDEMKVHVENGQGLVYNPISEGIMTKEGSIEFVNTIEDIMDESNTEKITEEITEQAFIETRSENTLEIKEPQIPSITPRVSTPPGNKSYYTLTKEYGSGLFTGKFWQYSGYRFRFANGTGYNSYDANPFFGLKAEKDSFYFKTYLLMNGDPCATVVVQPNAPWIYLRSQSTNGWGGFYGIFSTYNPVMNSRYFIY